MVSQKGDGPEDADGHKGLAVLPCALLGQGRGRGAVVWGQAGGGGAGRSLKKSGSRKDIWEGFLRKGVVERERAVRETETEAETETCTERERD